MPWYHEKGKHRIKKIVNICFASSVNKIMDCIIALLFLFLLMVLLVDFPKVTGDSVSNFELLSGLSINCGKSSIFYSNCSDETKMIISSILSVQEKHLLMKYLGLPLFSSRMKKGDYQPIVDKIRKALAGWKSNLLSFAGRLELLTSMLCFFSHLLVLLLSLAKAMHIFNWETL